MDDVWDHVIAYWQGNLHHLVPRPEQAEKSIYTKHAQWMAALQELAPAAYYDLAEAVASGPQATDQSLEGNSRARSHLIIGGAGTSNAIR